jgi:hypothetical protein
MDLFYYFDYFVLSCLFLYQQLFLYQKGNICCVYMHLITFEAIQLPLTMNQSHELTVVSHLCIVKIKCIILKSLNFFSTSSFYLVSPSGLVAIDIFLAFML